MENRGNGEVYFHKKTQCYEKSEQTHDIQTSGLLSKFAEQLHGPSFTKEQRREENTVQDHKSDLLFVLNVPFSTCFQIFIFCYL